MFEPISITAIASLSALGHDRESVRNSYISQKPLFQKRDFGRNPEYAAPLKQRDLIEIEALGQSDLKYRQLDPSVLYAISVSRRAVAEAGWTNGSFGVNIGSSRGATSLFEKHHADFLTTGKTNPLASPVTTLGNISSWVAHDLQATGPEISHSITCSTALHAVLNGAAWLRAGMADRFLVGGSEAPLTPFTIAQMKAMKIYADPADADFPSRAFDLEKTRNSMILGEGAAACCIEMGKKNQALAYISGLGYATEMLEHNASISAEADCFKKSMRMALTGYDPAEIDAIVMHAPGTVKGDLSEMRAIQSVFGSAIPSLTTNKWLTGHTFGASGLLGMEMAVLMMQENTFFSVPFAEAQPPRKSLKKILVNAVGFGGNAVTVLLEKA